MEGVAGNECVSREGTVPLRRFLGAQSRGEGQSGQEWAGWLPPALPQGSDGKKSPASGVGRAGFESQQCHFPAALLLLLLLFTKLRKEKGPFSGGDRVGRSLPAPGMGSGEDGGTTGRDNDEASGQGDGNR